MPRPIRLVAVLVIGLVVLACAGPAPTPTPEPTSTPTAPAARLDAQGSWQLEKGLLDGVPLPIVEGYPVTMTVDGSQIGGTSACNGYGAEMTVVGGALALGEWSSTAMLCEEPVMASEVAFMTAMGRVRAAQMDGPTLVLAGDGVTLRFSPLEAPPTAEIVGTDWRLVSLIDGDAASDVDGDPATLRLEADGSLVGSTGCRTFSGRYIEAGAEIVFTDFGMDQTDCRPELADQDGHVVGVLGDGFRAVLDAGQLTVTGSGEQGLVYVAAD